jgi:Xaa-Pro aminopeptidase
MDDVQDFPRFSQAERDRRWAEVRRLMAERDLAVIVLPNNSGHSTDFQANSRYLSHCGGGSDADIAVVFPLDGDVTAIATTAEFRWRTTQDWVTDIREARRNYGKVIVERLRELGVAGKRIGIAGLGRGTRTPEGTILYQTMRKIIREFPSATVVDATGILEEVRLVKSDEEVEFLTRSNELVDRAFAVELAEAKAGAVDHEVWAKATAAMLIGGSEPTLHVNWVSGPAPMRTLTRASFRRLERGDIIINELEASWAGYRAQGVQPICVQTCDPVYPELMKLQGEIWHELFAMFRPGTTIGELCDAVVKINERERPATGPAAGALAHLTMHGRGQGDDGPIVTGSARLPYQLRRELRPGMVCILKPEVRAADRSHPTTWGDTVVVTEDGGRRLGQREHGIWVA